LEELYEELDNIENSLPHIPPFEALRLYFSQPLEACPSAMMDSYYLHLMEAEQAVREYNTLPYDGGLWDQPLQLLRIFTVVRSERNQYERIRFEKMKKKSSKMSSGQQTPNAGAFKASDLPPLGRNIK
jgi:hypothetical protein